MGINLFSSTLSERETDWGVFIYLIDENSPHFLPYLAGPFPNLSSGRQNTCRCLTEK